MKIKCLVDIVTPDLHDERIVQWAKKSELEITMGKVYVVLAITKFLMFFFTI